MPVPLAAKAGVIAVSVAVAAAIAVYESPELRRMADDLRRRIAIALHSLGDGIQPNQREPIFNRPEDAEGFLQSRAEPGVDADEETRRRQREELMYWNSVRLQKQEAEQRAAAQAASAAAVKQEEEESSFARNSMYGSTFDDFMTRDATSGDGGTYVFNTGADARTYGGEEGLVRRRGDGVRGLNASLYANPFADENGIELDEQHPVGGEIEDSSISMMSPSKDEVMSDIYNATDPASPVLLQAPSATVLPSPVPAPVPGASADHNIGSILFDAANHLPVQQRDQTPTVAEDDIERSRSHTLDGEQRLGQDEYMTAGQDDRNNESAYASIQAWAQDSTNHTGFYSPLPMSTPAGPLSEPELISQGALTPTDSASVVGSTVGSEADVVSAVSGGDYGDGRRLYDVMSDSDDDEEGRTGIATPVSWTEVGSVVSESDAGLVHA